MLALCLMLLATYYAQNYAGIIGWSLGLLVDGLTCLWLPILPTPLPPPIEFIHDIGGVHEKSVSKSSSIS